MSINKAFYALLAFNEPNQEEIFASINSIVKKLDSIYYNSDGKKHFIISGSFGRRTAIKTSDVDLCYILPLNDYYRFCNRKGNIQSQLLTEIKTHIQARYPNSIIKSDGQVVDALFKKTVIELVPSFNVDTNSNDLKYPNTHNDGTWLTTNPIEQQRIIGEFSTLFPAYRKLCKLIRCWRDENSVSLKGIEIDLLVYDFLNNNSAYKNLNDDRNDYIACLLSFFQYLQADGCKHIQVIGDYDIKTIELKPFHKLFKRVEKKLLEENMAILRDNCISLFGSGFPENPYYSKTNKANEQFIQDLFQVRIRYKLNINCNISTNGFLVKKLKDLLNTISSENRYIVKQSKSLDFYIEYCDVPLPYNIYRKIRNVGEEARKRDDIRGMIIKGGDTHHEKSKFCGPHYVECFIVKDNICVARARIDVPIE